MQEPDNSYITMDQLKVGLYVYLDLKWFEHPFAFNNFKIKDEEQIAVIKTLGLRKVRYDAARSDQRPAPSQPEKPRDETATAPILKEHPALAAKRALVEKIRVQREASARIETAFVDTAKTIHDVEKNLLAHPEETLKQADQLVEQIADSILSAPELKVEHAAQ